jgi:hypothetical protein
MKFLFSKLQIWTWQLGFDMQYASTSIGKGQINLPSHPQIAQSVTIGWLCRLTTIEING